MTRFDPYEIDPGVGRGRRRPNPAIPRKEVSAVNQNMNTIVIAAVNADRIGRYRREAEVERIRRETAPDRRIRRTIGRSLVRFGERLAAEPDANLTPAASR